MLDLINKKNRNCFSVVGQLLPQLLNGDTRDDNLETQFTGTQGEDAKLSPKQSSSSWPPLPCSGLATLKGL